MPDMVISGINHGANMGDDTIYSGTVAAATEGYPAGHSVDCGLARQPQCRSISTPPRAWWPNWCSASRREPPTEPMLLNVNVPDRAWADLGGLR